MLSHIENLVDLAMPRRCAGCGVSRTEICQRCATALNGSVHRVYVKGIRRDEFPILATSFYEGLARNILLAAKERNQIALIPAIAKSALVSVSTLLATVPTPIRLSLVPVPSMPRNIRLRGYNLVAQMTKLVATHLSMQIDDVRVFPILRHAKRVTDQSRLTAKQRAINLNGAFTMVDDCLPALENRQVVIVDDLVTTGSTLLEARRSLLVAGANLLGAACAMSSP